jgi:hypothetical protein
MPRRSGRQPVRAKVLSVGAAGVAAALAVVPVAAAQSTHPGRTHSPAKPLKPGSGVKVQPEATTTSTVGPGFGWQKFRVGVQIKTGAWVPAGTNTIGSQVHIVETDDHGTTVDDSTCTTEAETVQPGSTESYCTFDNPISSIARSARAQPADPSTGNLDDYYIAAPGDTVTLTQMTVEPNLVIDLAAQTKDPVENGCESPLEACADTGPVTFNDGGPPPMATDDSATTQSPKSVDIDALANDDPPDGAPTTLSVVEHPAHGSAQPINQPDVVQRHAGAPGQAQFRYTPNAGFVGNDSFVYRLSTPNGSTTATVHITVTAPPPTANDDSAATTSGHSVTIHVLKNDDANGGGVLHLKSVGSAGHGSTDTDGSFAVYTANKHFVGTDTFTYVASTKFGTATATVTVTVTAPPVTSPTPSPTSPSSSASNGGASTSAPASGPPLASTGVPVSQISELAVGLLVVGGAATVAGRRRRRGGHAS